MGSLAYAVCLPPVVVFNHSAVFPGDERKEIRRCTRNVL